jgi:hypothetical protein
MFLSFLLRYFRDPRLEQGTATFSTPAKPAPETQVIHLGYFPDPERTSFAPER